MSLVSFAPSVARPWWTNSLGPRQTGSTADRATTHNLQQGAMDVGTSSGQVKKPIENPQYPAHSGLHNPIPYGIFTFPAIFEIKHLARKLYLNMV